MASGALRHHRKIPQWIEFSFYIIVYRPITQFVYGRVLNEVHDPSVSLPLISCQY